uniref:Uncharacterized protein n=1 Tax=Strigops habroptila TaxID=2489341 RepID=A0A672V1Y1_STRHB
LVDACPCWLGWGVYACVRMCTRVCMHVDACPCWLGQIVHVCVSMCVCMRVCACMWMPCVCVCTHVCARMWVRVPVACVCVHACGCVSLLAGPGCACVRMNACVDTCACARMCVCMHVCAYVHMRVCSCVHMCLHSCACVCTCVHACVCVCMCAHTCMHAHMHACAPAGKHTCAAAHVRIYMLWRSTCAADALLLVHMCLPERACVCKHVCPSARMHTQNGGPGLAGAGSGSRSRSRRRRRREVRLRQRGASKHLQTAPGTQWQIQVGNRGRLHQTQPLAKRRLKPARPGHRHRGWGTTGLHPPHPPGVSYCAPHLPFAPGRWNWDEKSNARIWGEPGVFLALHLPHKVNPSRGRATAPTFSCGFFPFLVLFSFI